MRILSKGREKYRLNGSNVAPSRRGMIIHVKFLEVISASLSADQRVSRTGLSIIEVTLIAITYVIAVANISAICTYNYITNCILYPFSRELTRVILGLVAPLIGYPSALSKRQLFSNISANQFPRVTVISIENNLYFRLVLILSSRAITFRN